MDRAPLSPADAELAAKRLGMTLVALAGVLWSLQGLTVRLIEEAEPAQIVFWRSLSQLCAMLVVVAIVNRGRVADAFRRAGRPGVVGGLCALVAGTCFVFALTHTTVANVVFVMAASPLFAAAMAWLFLRETIEKRTLLSMVAALAGIGVMMGQGLSPTHTLGNIFAVITTIGFAGIAVVARWGGGGVGMLPAICWGGAFTMMVSFVLSGGEVAVPLSDIAWAAVSGGILTASGATCFMMGARYVPAGVLAFLTLTEIVLAPIWVWVALSETPTPLTLIGGFIVLAAIVFEAVLRARDSSRRRTDDGV